MRISDIKNNTLRRTAVVIFTTLAVVAFTLVGITEAIWRGAVAAYDVAKDYGSEIRDIVEGARDNWQSK